MYDEKIIGGSCPIPQKPTCPCNPCKPYVKPCPCPCKPSCPCCKPKPSCPCKPRPPFERYDEQLRFEMEVRGIKSPHCPRF